MDYAKKSLELHYELKGKIEVASRTKANDRQSLSLAYTPGVAAPCLEIQKDVNKSYELTRRWNTVAVVTDGTAVLGLGDIGPEAGMPVMEGKCALFKAFADVDAFPLCIRSKDPDEIVRTVSLLAGSFGGINLEDISAPKCFEIEEVLERELDIPVFHDDQHGTAIVVSAALTNALKVAGRVLADCRIVLNGPGAAGTAITKMLLTLGARDVVVCDRRGAIFAGREGLAGHKLWLAEHTNPRRVSGSLSDALRGADVFIGVSSGNLVTQDMVRSMAPDPVVFAMANPTPEIAYADALAAGARVAGTGRSDCPNQINNVLAFPGVFRGALSVRARDINSAMKAAAVNALAGLVGDELSPEHIIPDAFDARVAPAIAEAVARAAVESGVARI